MLAALGMACVASATAAPRGAFDACFVRIEPPDAAASAAATSASAPAQSFVGLRRKTEQLFDLDISVSGTNLANCAVAGTAKLRGEAGSEVLAMVVRPDPSRKSGRSGTLCQVFVQLTPGGVELRTTPAACQAQALCEGKVELNGQRFESATKLPAGSPGPCFEKRAP